MEQENLSDAHTKSVYILAIILALGFLYMLYDNIGTLSNDGQDGKNFTSASMVVKVENTLAVDGVLSAPKGFPQDIPLESQKITDSAVTLYPHEHLKQLSLSYQSVKSMDQKYTEYVGFMRQAGYEIEKEQKLSTKGTISGKKEEAMLSVILEKGSGVGTLVQILYIEPKVEN